MLACLICAVVGGLQTYLLSVVLKGAMTGNAKKACFALLGKFFGYGIALSLLWFLFMDSVFYAAAGFIIGVVASVIVIAVKGFLNKSKEGDDLNGHSGAD